MDAHKTIDKIQHLFMIKTSGKLSKENVSQFNKEYLSKNITPYCGNIECYFSVFGNETNNKENDTMDLCDNATVLYVPCTMSVS